MTNTYFEYALSNCRSNVIKNVCEHYTLKNKLLESVDKEWNMYFGITSDRSVLHSIQSLFGHEGYLYREFYSGDSKHLYNRCLSVYSDIMKTWKENKIIEYERLFDSLVDICWLIASIYNSENKNARGVILLSNHNTIRESMKLFLKQVYIDAINNHKECSYISEGIKAKRQHIILPWLYDNEYEESMYYIKSNMTPRELEQHMHDYAFNCTTSLSIYYSLTATVALAENIRRYG